VQGCDGSFLLDSTTGNPAEKDSHFQMGMRNEKYVNDIKAAVELECPGVVSCADILALGGAVDVSMVSAIHTMDLKLAIFFPWSIKKKRK
jgi:peroxidase